MLLNFKFFFRQICLPVYFVIIILLLNFENKSENTGKARSRHLSALHKIAKAFRNQIMSVYEIFLVIVLTLEIPNEILVAEFLIF